MSLLKTGACFTAELELNCPTIVACVAALPVGAPAVAGDLVLGPDSQYHALPAAPAQVPQTLTLAGQTLTLSNGGGSVVLPDLDTQDISISGNVISLTNGGSVTLPTSAAPVPQVLSIVGSTVSLSGGGGSVTVPDADTQDLSLVGNVLSLTNGGSVTLPTAAAQDPYATPAQTIAGTATALIVNPADLYARENIPAQTGLSNDVTAIPAPGPNQSVWGVNALGETLHYAPGLGWKIVTDLYGNAVGGVATPLTVNAWTPINGSSFIVPRTGKIMVSAQGTIASATSSAGSFGFGIAINGVLTSTDQVFYTTPVNNISKTLTPVLPGTVSGNFVAGDVISFYGLSTAAGYEMQLPTVRYQYAS